MKTLKRIVDSLSLRELELLKKVYHGGEIISKKAELLEYILSHEKVSNREAALKVYEANPDAKFSMLKGRLKKDVFNILLLEEGKKKYNTTLFSKRFDTKQLIIDAEILFSRGLIDIGTNILLKALKVASEYEFTLEVLMIHDLLQRYLGIKDYEKYELHFSKKMSAFIELENKYKAQEHFDRITIPTLHSSREKESSFQTATKMLNELGKLNESSSSKEVESLYLRAVTYCAHLERNYDKAHDAALLFKELVYDEKSLQSKSKTAGSNMQLAIIQIYREDYLDAAKYANLAIEGFVKKSRNELNAFGSLFHAKFYDGKFLEAKNIVDKCLDNPTTKRDSFLKSVWTYRKACVLFEVGEVSMSLNILQKVTKILSDRTGWRIGVKVLEILCLIKLRKYDFVDYRLDSFYKLLLSIKSKKESRPFLTYRCLNEMSKHHSARATESFQRLFDMLVFTTWDPLGYELIRFDKWLAEYGKTNLLLNSSYK